MKKLLFIALAAFAVTFTACKKEEEDKGEAPSIVNISLSTDNTRLTVSFDMAVFSADNGTGALSAESLNLTISGGIARIASYTVTHTPGAQQLIVDLKLIGAASGQELLVVRAANDNSIFSAKGAPMTTVPFAATSMSETGVIGRWQSSGTNVAPLLKNSGIDSIYAEFRTNFTYFVEAFQADGSKTTLTGNYVQQKSAVGSIYTIRLTQNTPTALVSEGIFEVKIDGSVTTMDYEVAQTDPNIPGVIPPTPQGGFGSTSGGLFGTANLQKYVKL
jgi:hypothetical protein